MFYSHLVSHTVHYCILFGAGTGLVSEHACAAYAFPSDASVVGDESKAFHVSGATSSTGSDAQRKVFTMASVDGSVEGGGGAVSVGQHVTGEGIPGTAGSLKHMFVFYMSS